jgi:hypothetical protein
MLKVTNRNDFDLMDRYNGEAYFFPKGKTVMCPDDAARHIFGIGDEDKKPYLTRQGWSKSSDKFEDGMEKLNKFSFELVEEKYDVEFARIEQRTSPSANAGAMEEAEADDSVKSVVPAPKRNILSNLIKRQEQPAA